MVRNRCGADAGTAKLDDDKAREIAKSDVPRAELAKKWGVSPSVISAIKNGKTWVHATKKSNINRKKENTSIRIIRRI